MTGFYDTDPEDVNFVPFDIETTGFKATQGDFVTTFVLHNDGNYHIWINTGGKKASATEMQKKIREDSGFENTVLYLCENEAGLLENVGDYLDTHTDENTILTAFNGETFKGNTDFDVPFLRTRCFRVGVSWILEGYWYADIYEVFTDSCRFDTTMKAEPSLEDMKKTDVQQFADDTGFDIHYGNMKKAELTRAIDDHDGVTTQMLRSWIKNDSNVGLEAGDPENPKTFNKSTLQNFIDSMSVDIPYEKLSKDDLIQEIREREYEEDMLIEWHKHTGRSIGTTEASKLDGIHEAMIEDKNEDDDWIRSLPFELEVFEPFDPFIDSGEAVTAYMNDQFADVILHCFADVARTVNLNRMMAEYAPRGDYEPKIL